MEIIQLDETKRRQAYIRDWLGGNRELFELMLLGTVWHNLAAFQRISAVLCRAGEKGDRWVDDFSRPEYCAVYKVIFQYNCQHLQKGNSETTFHPIGEVMAASYLANHARMGDGISEDECRVAMQIFAQATNYAKPEFVAVVDQAITEWLSAQKIARTMRSITARADADTLVNELQKTKAALDPSRNRVRMYGFGHGIDNEMLDVERVQTRMSSLDIALGGGVGRGEATLIIAAEGVGKTVLACQLGSGMSINGAKGILISTEQGHEQLEPRIVSARCGVPFDLIKDKVKVEVMHADQRKKYDELRSLLGEHNFQIIDWQGESDRNIFSVADQIVDEAQQRMGRLDYVILDWLGAAIGKQVTTDPGQLRHILKNGADAGVDLAVKYGLASIVFAQADPTKGYDRMRIDASCISECKTMGQRYTNTIGITGFRSKEEEVRDFAASFQDLQYLYISKARKSAGARLPMQRDFKYQRFIPQ